MPAAIELAGVTKRFGDITAVEDLDLTVEEGEIFGFLGPNGAGKSTTINMALDFVRPTAGTVTVLGRNAQSESVRIRQRTGLLPERFGLYDRLTGRQHLEFAIDSKNASDNPTDVLDRVGLGDAIDRQAGEYSTGMAQRLALAMALVGDPELLILDEPSTGLDPAGTLEIREIVREENQQGTTVFFSSHLLDQVEAVCDRVGILRAGRMVAEDSVAGLRKRLGDDATLRITVDEPDEEAVNALAELEGVSEVTVTGRTLTVGCSPDTKTAVLRHLEAAGVGVSDFETEDTSLEELFMAYTQGEDA